MLLNITSGAMALLNKATQRSAKIDMNNGLNTEILNDTKNKLAIYNERMTNSQKKVEHQLLIKEGDLVFISNKIYNPLKLNCLTHDIMDHIKLSKTLETEQ
jgi:hypothetical protein